MYYVNSPLDVGLGAAGALLQSQQAKKQQDLENKRQAELDRQNAALTAAQIEQMKGKLAPVNVQMPQGHWETIAAPAAAAATSKTTKYRTSTAGGRTTATYEGQTPGRTLGTVTNRQVFKQAPFELRRQKLMDAYQNATDINQQNAIARMMDELTKEQHDAQVSAYQWASLAVRQAQQLAQERHWNEQDQLAAQRIVTSTYNAIINGEYRVDAASTAASAMLSAIPKRGAEQRKTLQAIVGQPGAQGAINNPAASDPFNTGVIPGGQ